MTSTPGTSALPTVGQLSEADLLAAFLPLTTTDSPHVLTGPGDDAAVVAVPGGRAVVTTDTLVIDQDFRARWANGRETSGADVGHKCAAQNLADIAAMGGVATAAVISLTLPGDTPVQWVEDFAVGFSKALARLGATECAVVGGDLGRGRELSVTATLMGVAPHGPTLRSGAVEGGTLVHAGVLGWAAAGLDALETAGPSGWDDLPWNQRLLVEEAQLRPRPPLALGPAAARAGASAMIDISDGLLRDAARLARASGVVIDLDPEALEHDVVALSPVAHVAEVDPWRWVLTGGEDHGLLAVIPAAAQVPPGMRAIGSCAPADPERVATGHSAVAVAGKSPAEWLGYDVGEGWDHFEP